MPVQSCSPTIASFALCESPGHRVLYIALCAHLHVRKVLSICLQNWDGSGGNGAALRHFEATGSKYPLVVKLGTITPHGADVFSYAPDENDMVEDPKLVSS